MDPFAPQDIQWRPVSPRLALVRRLVLGAVTLVVVLALAVLAAVVGTPWLLVVPVAALVGAAAAYVVIGRQARAIGYAEREDDLLIRRGVMFRSLVVVPYGRMQYVDVQAGPVDRRFGLARVQLHTASPGTDASIPGLAPDEAARLRDRLARRGEARLAGL